MKTQKTVTQVKVSKQHIAILRAFMGREIKRYALDQVNYANDELAATDGRGLVVIKPHINLNLEDGMYDIKCDCLVKSDFEGKFAKYRTVIPEYKSRLTQDNIGKGLARVMIQAKIGIDVAAFAKQLKALDNLGRIWNFFAGEPNQPLLIECQLDSYAAITVVLMPFVL